MKTINYGKFYKEILSTLCLTAVYILFHGLFEEVFTSYLVKPFLSKVESNGVNDLVVFGVIITISYKFYTNFKNKYTITLKSLTQSSIVLITYLIYRFYFEYWEFTEFKALNSVKYLDVILLYFSANAILYFLLKFKRQKTESKQGFYIDSPLGKNNPDILNREKIAIDLCKEIESTYSAESSFALGISSEWGYGKTSFLDLMERHLKSDKNIIIKFNPWINHYSKNIVKDFFNELNSQLSVYISDITQSINKYAKLLVEIGDSNLNKIFTPILKLNSHNSTALSEFQQINNSIQTLNKKLVIFIDDLDRLYKEEIIEVVKLIRNSANFGNTIFIVAYDRNYVVNAIRNINSYNPEYFLEKIFQLEIRLPNFETQVIQKRIFDLLSPRVNKEDKDELLALLLNKRNLYESNIFNIEVLTTLRDATRFSNSFLVAYNYLKGEIVLSDLLNLELLRLKFSSIYRLVFFQTEEFLEAESVSYNNTVYTLKQHKKEGSKTGKTLIKEYIQENCHKIGISESEVDIAMGILYSLFPNSDSTYFHRDVGLLSVSNPSSFERYSHYRLLDSDISEIEFSHYRLKNIDEFCTKIEYWIKKGLRWELKRRFENISTFSSKEDFEKIINATFYFARYPKIESIDDDYNGFDFNNLYSKLDKAETYIDLKFYPDKETYKKFLLQIFENAPSPYEFDIDFIYTAFDKYSISYNFIVPKEDFQRIRFSYFKNYIKSANKIDSHIWHLYHYNELREAKPKGGGSYQIIKTKNPEASKLLVNFIKTKALDSFLFSIITNQPFNKKGYAVSEIVKTLFGGYIEFGEFLKGFNSENYEYLDEFNVFYYKFSEEKYTNYVEFNFKIIPISEKQW